MNKKNFIFDCLHGLSDIKDIDSYVEAWHNGTSNVELSSFLGMTQEEYETWVQNGDSALKDILHNRTKSVKQKWIDLLDEEVYERLCNCCSRKSDILPLVQAKWSFFKDKKDYDKEQALSEVLELLDCNSQYIELSADEYASILKRLEM